MLRANCCGGIAGEGSGRHGRHIVERRHLGEGPQPYAAHCQGDPSKVIGPRSKARRARSRIGCSGKNSAAFCLSGNGHPAIWGLSNIRSGSVILPAGLQVHRLDLRGVSPLPSWRAASPRIGSAASLSSFSATLIPISTDKPLQDEALVAIASSFTP